MTTSIRAFVTPLLLIAALLLTSCGPKQQTGSVMAVFDENSWVAMRSNAKSMEASPLNDALSDLQDMSREQAKEFQEKAREVLGIQDLEEDDILDLAVSESGLKEQIVEENIEALSLAIGVEIAKKVDVATMKQNILSLDEIKQESVKERKLQSADFIDAEVEVEGKFLAASVAVVHVGDGSFVFMGTTSAVEASVNRFFEGKKELPAHIQAFMGPEGEPHAWALVLIPEEMKAELAKGGSAGMLSGIMDAFKELNTVFIQANALEVLELKFILDFAAAEQAAKLQQMLQGFLAMFGQQPGVQTYTESLRIDAQDTKVNLLMTLDEAQIRELVEKGEGQAIPAN